MVKVRVEVRSEAARFKGSDRAESIRRALSLAGERYPKGEVEVKSPTDPGGFFAEGPTASREASIGIEAPAQRMAA